MLLWILGMAGVFGQRGLMGSVQEAYQAAEAEVSIQTDTKESRRLALTFDDGPHPYYTELLLDGLAERRVKATFFLLGANIEGREDVVKRMAEEE